MAEPELSYPVRKAAWSEDVVESKLQAFHDLRQRKARVRRAAGVSVLAAASLALGFVAWDQLGPGARVQEQASLSEPSSDGRKPVSTGAGARDLSVPMSHQGEGQVSFPDGSHAQLLTEEARLSVLEVTGRAVSVDLPAGEAKFEVTPNPARRFVVKARDVLITVLGTKFLVTHEGARTRVAVEEGKVRVDYLGDKTLLTRGEARWFEKEPTGEAEEATLSEGKPSLQGSHAPPENEAASRKKQFLSHHKKAEYAEAYAILAQDRTVAGTTSEELMKAADAARYSGHPKEATAYLKRIPSSHSLGVAALFTLGRLYLHELGQPVEAANAFSRVRALSPGGPLAEDALFREVEARAKAGQSGEAQKLAQKYGQLYPTSRRRAAVERISGLK